MSSNPPTKETSVSLQTFAKIHGQREAAKLLNIHESTISKMISAGRSIIVVARDDSYWMVESKVISK